MNLKIFKTNVNCVTTIWDSRKDTVWVFSYHPFIHMLNKEFSTPLSIKKCPLIIQHSFLSLTASLKIKDHLFFLASVGSDFLSLWYYGGCCSMIKVKIMVKISSERTKWLSSNSYLEGMFFSFTESIKSFSLYH